MFIFCFFLTAIGDRLRDLTLSGQSRPFLTEFGTRIDRFSVKTFSYLRFYSKPTERENEPSLKLFLNIGSKNASFICVLCGFSVDLK